MQLYRGHNTRAVRVINIERLFYNWSVSTYILFAISILDIRLRLFFMALHARSIKYRSCLLLIACLLACHSLTYTFFFLHTLPS